MKSLLLLKVQTRPRTKGFDNVLQMRIAASVQHRSAAFNNDFDHSLDKVAYAAAEALLLKHYNAQILKSNVVGSS